jgi:hypothetical protein
MNQVAIHSVDAYEVRPKVDFLLIKTKTIMAIGS